MPTFMEKCNCRGVKPSKVLGKKCYSRPEVLMNLLQDRHVARLLRAPTGSGKSSLAFEYTNIVFGFERVFWVDCTSPCFLRDLDNDALFRSVIQIGEDTQLVVCDDIPLLDQQRSELLNSFVDNLLGEGIEVLLTCTPASDTFSHLQRDAVVLGPVDLLLTDLEMEGAESAGLLGGRRVADTRPQDRIACMLWSGEGNRIMLSGLKDEALDKETRLAMFAMLVLQDAAIDCLKEIIRPEAVAGVLETIMEGYICFGLDMRMMSFQTIVCSIEEVSNYFCKDIADLCGASVHRGKDELCCIIADMLLSCGHPRRACEFMTTFAERKCSIAWLCDKGMSLLHDGEAESLLYLYDKAKRVAGKDRGSIDILVMLALLQVDDIPAMAAAGKRVLRNKTFSLEERSAAASIILKCSEKMPSIDTPQKLEEMAALVKTFSSEPITSKRYAQPGDRLDFALISKFYNSLEEGPLELMMEIASRIESHNKADEGHQFSRGTEDALFIGMDWLFELLDGRRPDKDKVQQTLLGDSESPEDYMKKHSALREILEFMCAYIEQVNVTEMTGYYACRATIAFKNMSVNIFHLFDIQKEKRQFAIFEKFEAKLTERRDRYRRRCRQDEDAKREYILTHPDAFRRSGVRPSDQRRAHLSVPTMRVKLFGCMEIRIGDELINPSTMYRKKTKTLLALLVLGRDRECARDQLAQELWPNASMECARRNFYTVIAELRRALSVDGSCPYLIRTQSGYRLDMRLVTSDVYEFDDICRSLLFERTEAPEWEHLYAQVTKEYSGLLMPSEEENDTIISLRKRMNLQLVDGLLATSARLMDDGQCRGALWFAREAMAHDDKREDVYITLMDAQIACDQRGEALDTYFSCVRFLNEGLGIDPSRRLVEKYRSIIESEEDF